MPFPEAPALTSTLCPAGDPHTLPNLSPALCTLQAALNPANSQSVSYEKLLSSLARFSAGLAWETPRGVRAPLDALHVLAAFMQTNRVGGRPECRHTGWVGSRVWVQGGWGAGWGCGRRSMVGYERAV